MPNLSLQKIPFEAFRKFLKRKLGHDVVHETVELDGDETFKMVILGHEKNGGFKRPIGRKELERYICEYVEMNGRKVVSVQLMVGDDDIEMYVTTTPIDNEDEHMGILVLSIFALIIAFSLYIQYS